MTNEIIKTAITATEVAALGTQQNTILNSKLKDSGGKIIFGNNKLCSQFIRDYIDLPGLEDVRPEDIEDVSEQFVPLFAEERNADRVKRVHLKRKVITDNAVLEEPLFLISLIEHKTKVE